jgi:hypothetical protein
MASYPANISGDNRVEAMYKVCVYIPESSLARVKQAMFAAGAGEFGNYDSCAWQVVGRGQFRPLKQSDPVLGEQGVLAHVPEYKVEMVCGDMVIGEVIGALVEAHPYEEPAYQYWLVNPPLT